MSTSNYHNFVLAIQKQLTKMAKTGLFEVAADKDVVWNHYLDSFPAGTNLMFRERREYDCNCCKQFIRDVGRVVTFVDGKRVSIWDIKVPGYYQAVVDSLSKLIHAAPIADEFLHFTTKVGTAQSNVLENDQVVTYNHFHAVLPQNFVKPNSDIATALSRSRSNVQVLERSLIELTADAAETIIELNAQGSLYRGNEQIASVNLFLDLKNKYVALDTAGKEAFVWTNGLKLGERGKFRNTAIGTLLEDLSGGMDIESAVKRWEKVMAPANYKRPTALVTEAMIKKAQEKVQELGLMDSLPRRYAVLEDLTVNNVLFADRNTQKATDVFGDLLKGAKKPVKGPANVEEISIEKFIREVLPTATSIEALVENRHTGNLVSLVAPVYPDAPNMLKWDNNFSWSYNGEVTDSIKERVKAAGGKVEGALRISLAWNNGDDLDLHMRTPRGEHLYYGNRRGGGAYLDLDMNGMDKHDDLNPVENIIFERESQIEEGIYKVWVNQYNVRSRDRVGFTLELEHGNTTLEFSRPQAMSRGSDVDVITFRYTRKGGVEVIESLPHSKQSKDVWGMATEQFQKVSVIMNSPNHWDGQAIGNKHYFFMLEGAKQPGTTRGFYNEYLRNELNDHRKVFEHLAGKMKVPASDEQLSGLGFSDTQRNELTVKVTGAFTRTLKVIF
ncbi:hypothetical protein ADU18_0165 [Cronobacter phage PBES 02]|uniref:Uncharacterized protein n=1 Tax=Cronobacter phage PBES 02 TaxID=1684115 RepID=A0A0K1YAD9_9CAUD|nr:hypothetical protein ADU18_0165 [Cronobacter phage PBES 02]AKY04065.1 hypothetical protein ADU18_0165 [Cronobacter phage PBES 02]